MYQGRWQRRTHVLGTHAGELEFQWSPGFGLALGECTSRCKVTLLWLFCDVQMEPSSAGFGADRA